MRFRFLLPNTIESTARDIVEDLKEIIFIQNLKNINAEDLIEFGITSTKFENNDHLFSAALRLNAFVKNAVAFL